MKQLDEADARRDVDRLNRELHRNLFLETALIAFVLGAVTILSMGLVFYAYATHNATLLALGLYVLVVHVAFHLCEFFIAALLRPHDTHPDAFMILHSKEYVAASSGALLEFFVEAYFVPGSWKLCTVRHPILGFFFRVNLAGAALFTFLVVIFYGIRVTAMLQCGANFSLTIESERRGSHRLVTHGLYRYLRHPAYFGWFWRTCFAQCILANPLSMVVHTAVTWYFFHSRIPYEESTLERPDYFGEEYTAYRHRTFVGIPFCTRGK
ncbi:putative prenyl protein specific carboxyl methyltransferase [Leptomonas seymouri]|uniref:Protein-S-isoprenylcysteine O-methyltransferase n=1 Tax=Leptomonas seymouri TaxID=5684 RepID=A0A0N0P511_LEPSE|nr:putative prenyl protein specific carboxyl methyltransferase [Leptomonas seymouri]|eukprot:KPI85457.1 putative prenyl protein specific carboxyl methyltransferase [Leptomonas seymouri]